MLKVKDVAPIQVIELDDWCVVLQVFGVYYLPFTKVRDISEMPLSIQLLNDFSQPLGRLVHSSSRNRRATRPLRICCASSMAAVAPAARTGPRNSCKKFRDKEKLKEPKQQHHCNRATTMNTAFLQSCSHQMPRVLEI